MKTFKKITTNIYEHKFKIVELVNDKAVVCDYVYRTFEKMTEKQIKKDFKIENNAQIFDLIVTKKKCDIELFVNNQPDNTFMIESEVLSTYETLQEGLKK